MQRMFSQIFSLQNRMFFMWSILYLILIITMTNVALMLFATFVIAASLNPLVDKLVSKYNYKRSTASALVLSGFLGVILLLFLPVIVIGCNEIRHLGMNLSHHVDTIKALLQNIPFVRQIDLENIDIGAFLAGNSENIIGIVWKWL